MNIIKKQEGIYQYSFYYNGKKFFGTAKTQTKAITKGYKHYQLQDDFCPLNRDDELYDNMKQEA